MTASKSEKPGNGWFILAVPFISVVLSALTAAITAFFVLDATSNEVTYYVVNQDVPAGTQITEELLYPMVAIAGSQPPITLRLEEIRTGEVFSLFNLTAGDVLSYSNTGDLSLFLSQQKDDIDSSTTSDLRNLATNAQSALTKYPDAISSGYGLFVRAAGVTSVPASNLAETSQVGATEVEVVLVKGTEVVAAYRVSKNEATVLEVELTGTPEDPGTFEAWAKNAGGAAYTGETDEGKGWAHWDSSAGGFQDTPDTRTTGETDG